MGESNGAPADAASSERSESADALGLAAEAIAAYLDELDACRTLCLRHEATTGAYATEGAVHLVRAFYLAEDGALSHVRLAAESLPAWWQSPFWGDQKRRWRQLWEQTLRPGLSTRSRRCHFTQGVLWEDRPVLVGVFPGGSGGLHRMEMLLPPLEGAPELPLRTVATGLRCLEHVAPERVARAVPVSVLPGTPPLSLRDYLTRATPQNLCASQCFSRSGEEQSAPPLEPFP